MRPDLSLVIAVLAAVGYAGGSTLQSTAVNHRTRAGKAARTLHYFAGLVLDAIAWALSLVALHGLPVYVVQAVSPVHWPLLSFSPVSGSTPSRGAGTSPPSAP